MTTELWLLIASIILGLLQLIAASHLISFQYGYRWTASNREEAGPPLRGLANRVDLATTNFLETFPFFAALVLVAHVTHHHSLLTLWGCTPVFLGTLRVCIGCGGRLWPAAFCSFLEHGACGYGTFPGCAFSMNINA
jgi:Predicted membrane protein